MIFSYVCPLFPLSVSMFLSLSIIPCPQSVMCFMSPFSMSYCQSRVVIVFLSLCFLFYFDSLVFSVFCFLCGAMFICVSCVPHVFLLPFCIFKSSVSLYSLSGHLSSSHHVLGINVFSSLGFLRFMLMFTFIFRGLLCLALVFPVQVMV